MTLLEFFRAKRVSASIPTDRVMRQIMKVLQYRLQEVLREMRATGSAVNLGVDGWTDPRGRRSQGTTARVLKGTEAATAILALKEIKAGYESARELRVMVEYIQKRFGIRGRTLNISTDRCVMNESAFRGGLSPKLRHARPL
jgi:hypothetical protein